MSMREKEDKEAELRDMANKVRIFRLPNRHILFPNSILQARLERAGALGGLGAYGGDEDDEDEPVDAKDYYRSTGGGGETHFHSGGGGAASGGAYGRELGGKAEALESSDDDHSEVRINLRRVKYCLIVCFDIGRSQ